MIEVGILVDVHYLIKEVTLFLMKESEENSGLIKGWRKSQGGESLC